MMVNGDVDVEIGLPVVDGPNVAGLIDQHARLTHHWDQAGRLGAWSGSGPRLTTSTWNSVARRAKSPITLNREPAVIPYSASPFSSWVAGQFEFRDFRAG
jgi:hypothetical protein